MTVSAIVVLMLGIGAPVVVDAATVTSRRPAVSVTKPAATTRPQPSRPPTTRRAAASCARTGPRRIMPLGDSLTFGLHFSTGHDDSYRPHLWRLLRSSGFTDIDFVGTLRTGDNRDYDGDHNGFGGFTAGPDNGFPDENGRPVNNLHAHIGGFVRWEFSTNKDTGRDIVTSSDPDIVLLNIGTNDAESDDAAIFRRLDGLVRLIRSKAPEAIVIVSSIPPNDYATVLDKVGPQAQRIADRSDGRVLYADIRTRMMRGNPSLDVSAFSPEDWESPTDRHLSASGGRKFAAAWYPTVVDALRMPRCRPR